MTSNKVRCKKSKSRLPRSANNINKLSVELTKIVNLIPNPSNHYARMSDTRLWWLNMYVSL